MCKSKNVRVGDRFRATRTYPLDGIREGDVFVALQTSTGFAPHYVSARSERTGREDHYDLLNSCFERL